jgi:hypothetical protein
MTLALVVSIFIFIPLLALLAVRATRVQRVHVYREEVRDASSDLS